jgi:DDB1- and CUL4-associated factor 13
MLMRVQTLDRGEGEERGIRNPSRRAGGEIERQKEYVGAVKNAKLDYLFAKPFIAGMGGHKEGVTKIVSSPDALDEFVSLSYDGGVLVWDMGQRRILGRMDGGEGTRGVGFYRGKVLVGKGKRVMLYGREGEGLVEKEEYKAEEGVMDVAGGENAFYAGTAGGLEVFDPSRIQSVGGMKSGSECRRVRWNESFPYMVLGVNANKVDVYDARENARTMGVWANTEINGMEIDPSRGHVIVCGMGSGEAKEYDLRHLSEGSRGTEHSRVYRGHASPVLDLCYTADGSKIITGSSDRTMRVFEARVTHRQEQVYHNKRMQEVNAVCSSGDGTYVLSGSVDGNVRLWKTDANMSLKIMTPQERASREEADLLKNKFRDVKEMEDLRRHKVVPKRLKRETKNRYEYLQARKRRDGRVRENEGQ